MAWDRRLVGTMGRRTVGPQPNLLGTRDGHPNLNRMGGLGAAVIVAEDEIEDRSWTGDLAR